MHEEQDSFTGSNSNLRNLTNTVGGYFDTAKMDSIVTEVKSLNERLKAAEKEAGMYNSREALLGEPVTDYSMIKKTMDQFDPFLQFWTTVAAAYKTLWKCGKAFNLRALDKIAENCETTRSEVEGFKKFVPLIQALRNPGMAERHWNQLSEQLGFPLHPDKNFTMAKAEEMGLLNHLDVIVKVCDAAGKEHSIEKALDKMSKEWESTEMQVLDYRETKTFIIKVEEQISQMLDDHIVMTQSMTFSPFKKPFEERILKWEQQLNLVSEILEQWIAVQRQWMYLEPIFSSQDIMQQLPLEGKRFATVCNSQKLLDQFIEANKLLESVQKGLSDYLETKRLAFARFFFLSNDELLQILSQTKNPLSVQPHLRKCFEAIESLDFADNLEISGMNSKEKEKCPFDKPMFPTGSVEIWLGEVERRMKASVRCQVVESLANYVQVPRNEWVKNWPAMVVLAVSGIFWSTECEQAIIGGKVEDYLKKCSQDLLDLTDLVRGQLSNQDRTTLGALITVDVHSRDTVQELVDCKIERPSDFEWVSRLRYYWRDDVYVDMVQASINYGYEYIGNTPRLVITPLTDRCYMTLMSAMHLNLGGAPAGPSGTGKTETTKDLILTIQLAIMAKILTIQLAIMAKVDYKNFMEALTDACHSQGIQPVATYLEKVIQLYETTIGIQPVATYLEKVIQLYETTIVRHGLMSLQKTMAQLAGNGDPKSLQKTMTQLAGNGDPKYEKVRIVALNPKSITMGQLYGEFDENTHEWSDGVLACYMRECSEDPKPDKKWIMFDGPVDAVWIENMNTVLDDNKKLCLVSGEIIQLSEQMTMMFEVEDLAVASPATVSRCGMVYMEPTALGVEPLLTSWLQRLPPGVIENQAVLQEIFMALVPESLRFVRRNLKETVATVAHNLVMSCFNLVDSLVRPYIRTEGMSDLTAEEKGSIKLMLPSLMVFSIVWSVGASCDKAGRVLFDQFIRNQVNGTGEDCDGTHLACLPEASMFPLENTVYDWCYDQASMFHLENTVYDWCYDQEKSEWVPWMTTIPDFRCDPDQPFSSIIVPTADTVRYTYLIDRLVACNKHVLCVGDTGTGKTLNVVNKLMYEMPPEVIPVFMTFSARTSANQTMDIIDAKMDKRRKGVFGPPSGKKYVIFVDDLNMPMREKYFAQPPIELLRQWMDHGGWYEHKAPCAYQNIVDTQFVGSMGPPGGGRSPVTNRLLRHFMSSREIVGTSVKPLVPTDNIVDTQFVGSMGPSGGGRNPVTNRLLRHFMSWYERKAPCAYRNIVDTQFVGSMGPPGGGRNPVTNRLLRHFNFISFTGMSDESVSRIFSTILGSFLKKYFNESIQGLSEEVVASTVELYNSIPDAKTTSAPNQILSLWLHECVRVFEDRLTTEDDHTWFRNAQNKLLGSHFHTDYETTVVPCERLIFGDFMIPGADPKIFTQITDMPKLVKVVEEYLEDYNSVSNAPMKLVMFLDAIEHVSRVTRVIRLPLGNALLLGVGGSGRQSLTRLAAFMEEYDTFQIEIAKGYDNNAWREDLKKVLKKAGMDGKDTVFIFTDSQIVQAIGAAMRPLMTADGLQVTKVGIYSYFINRVRNYLHLVLCFSPIGNAFRQRLRMFPSGNETDLTPLAPQPNRRCFPSASADVALGEKTDPTPSVAYNFYADVEIESDTNPELLKTKQSIEIQEKEANEQAATAKDIADDAQRDSDEALPALDAAAAIATEIADDAQHDLDEALPALDAAAASAKEIADDAQRDLDEALPALDAAVASLKNLSRNDVVEVKAMQNPPSGVKLVMEAACIMFEEKPKMVDDPNRMGKKIPNYWIEASKKILNDPSKFLDSLLTAMYIYHNVALQVAPKRAALKGAQDLLAETMGKLAEAQSKLRAVEEKIGALEKSYGDAVTKKEALAQQVADCTVKLERADKLIGGLGGERVRWQETVAQLGKDMINVVGDVVVAAGSIAYSGPFTPVYRQQLTLEWVEHLQSYGVPSSEHTSLIKTLQIRMWTIAGLPTDNVSVENGIIVSKARRWPLMIDPQGQANKWIKNMEKESGLDVIKLSDKDFLRTLENGVRFGRAVLLENIAESLDAALEPLLLKQTFKQGGSEVIKIGDNIIPYHPDFRFYMTTKMRNPHYAPEVSVKVSLLNFFVTSEGLEEQLLGTVVTQERPDLANLKGQLVVSNAQMKKELKEIEDKILFMLSNSTGNILDDEELINTLSQSKVTSNEIQSKVAEAEVTEKQIDETRELYRPVAIRASLLFFCISDLALVDPMYQYSLAWFVNLFIKAIDEAPKSQDVAERGINLNEYFTYSLYVNICRSLFESHKLMFSLLLTVKEWRFLLAGPTSSEVTKENPAHPWLTDKSWIEVLNLAHLPEYEGFDHHFAENTAHYKGIFDSNDAHEMPLADPWQGKLSSFQKLLVLRCLRPDKVTMAIQNFVTEHMGQRFIEPPPFDLATCFKESAPATPLIFVLSSGADPMADLLKLADEMKFTKKFEKVSLGQGQGPKAEKLLEAGMDRGIWVCLQNCHLAVSWMPTLDRIVENIEPDKVHKDFRLWLTSMPSPNFPVSILQNGVKMTLEPPKGLKSNLFRQYNRLTDVYLNQSSKPESWRRLLFGLCLFHAVIQDRRKFGPLGWNIRYEFTDGDLNVSLAQMQEYLDKFNEIPYRFLRFIFTEIKYGGREYLDKYDEIPYRVLRFLFTEINYGGRVTDDKDRRLINNLVNNFCNNEVEKSGYNFSPSGTYTSAPCDTIKEYLEHIRVYPIVPKPEIFGLHENADITCDMNETYGMFEIVLSLQPRVAASGGQSQEEVPKEYDLEAVQKAYPTVYNQSMNTVLTQECIRYNNLLSTIARTLKETVKALKGLVVMSPELEAVAFSMYDNQVPDMWAAKAYPSLKPLSSWVGDLIERCKFVQKWIDTGIPVVYWISGFFFPQAFLTGTLQNFARKNGYAIDTVSFSFQYMDHLTEDVAEGPIDGCYIRGMFMEGARWDLETHQVGESRPKELFTDCPIVWLKPEQHRKKPTDGFYDCPVYKTLTRAGTLSTTGHSTNFVMYLELPSDKEQSHWINRGLALFTDLAF
eukprot:gene22533-29660_t